MWMQFLQCYSIANLKLKYRILQPNLTKITIILQFLTKTLFLYTNLQIEMHFLSNITSVFKIYQETSPSLQLDSTMKKETQTSREPSAIIEERINKVNGQTTLKRYRRGEFLGKGGFARCYQATSIQTGKVYAAKVVDKSTLSKNRAKQKLLSQIKIHKSLHHPYIVEFQNCFQDSQNVYIFLQLCPNKTLSQMLKKRKKLTPKQTKYFMLQILSAVQYMHSNRIIHRDLKMGNIFINGNMQLKVGDFGLATKLQFPEQKKRTVCGTPNYIAPQIIQGTVGHSYQVDIWSCGVICYALAFGKPPFETNQVKSTYAKIKLCKYQFTDSSVPDDIKDFIRKILVLDPKKRPTLNQLFQHPFLLNKEDVPKIIPIQALTQAPNFKYTNSEDKKKQTSKLKHLDFNKKKTEQQFIGLCTSPRSRFTDRAILETRQQKQRPKQKQKIVKIDQQEAFQQIFVLKHVDYSSKYGIGYALSNGHYGVYFNDSSKISLDATMDEVTFIAKGQESSKQQSIQTFTLTMIPKGKDFQKKYSLLQHFKYYLDAELKAKAFTPNRTNKLVYLKQWLKTKHAIMFRLSNKVFQVDFLDSTQILLNTQKKTVTYTSKKGQKSVHALSQALASTETEMARRIKYTKQILNSIKKSSEDPDINE